MSRLRWVLEMVETSRYLNKRKVYVTFAGGASIDRGLEAGVEIMQRKYAFIVNPASGAGEGAQIAAMLMRIVKDHPRLGEGEAAVFTVDRLSEDEMISLISESEMLIAVGGDGTVSQLISRMMQSKRTPALGVVPVGTSNDLARALGAPLRADFTDDRVLRATIDRLLSARPILLDILAINGRFFFCNYFSMGFDAIIVSDFAQMRKSRWIRLLPRGRFVNNLIYFLMGVKNAGFRLSPPVVVSIEYSGAEKRLTFDQPVRAVIVTNLPVYAGGTRINPGARLDDGRFEITVVETLFQFIIVILTRFLRFLTLPRGIVQVRAERAEIQLHGPAPCQIDGEAAFDALSADHLLKITRWGSIRIAV
ncbi:MAG: hypothetical protein C4520_16335 [Candidatus Abyssobacteria bacterium SURF_5]|uniref:diacylglycerol kinase (ATP) n=1 Tax=Abyssobacteria bacterium (strain SURF_5) TaxID=2093360 RepID=A0A3A4NPX9_ABYX5|nr:MAG: hypothetical protein C4520_16335 [Candidatus Abyssubacteria bacterium SURF_5]